MQVDCKVLIAEISGSESVVHFDLGGHDLGVAVARRARVQGGRGGALRAGRGALPVFRAGRRAGRGLRHRWRASAWRSCGTATSPTPAHDADWALKNDRPAVGRRRRLCAARPVRLRQDDPAQHRLRACCGPTAGRIRFGDEDVTDSPPDRRNIAQVFQFPVVYDTMTRVRQPRIPAAQPRRARGAGGCPRARDRGAARPGGHAAAARGGPDGRRQAEDLARPRPGALGRERDHVRRAADGDRPAPQVAPALEAEGAAPAHRHDHDLRDPRPDRGA